MNTHIILKKTRTAYELDVFSLWLRWCENYSHSDAQLHALLCNNSLFAWWQSNLETYEKIFSQEVALYTLACPPAVLFSTWQEYTSVILNIHSPVLIKQALNTPKTVTNDPTRN